MRTEEIIKNLRHYNEWRRGEIDDLDLSPKQIGMLIDCAIENLIDIDKINRLEVIDKGREYVKYKKLKDISIQDEGRTLKIFL